MVTMEEKLRVGAKERTGCHLKTPDHPLLQSRRREGTHPHQEEGVRGQGRVEGGGGRRGGMGELMRETMMDGLEVVVIGRKDIMRTVTGNFISQILM